MFMFSFKLIYGFVCVTLSTDLSAISCECMYMKTLLFVAVDTLLGLAIACHEVGGLLKKVVEVQAYAYVEARREEISLY